MSTKPPSIRTVTDRWDHPANEKLFGLLEALRRGQLTTDEYQRSLLELLAGARLGSSLAAEMAVAMEVYGQLELLRRHVDDCRYTVLLYRINEGEAHPPHHHFNLISNQVVLFGRIHLREYERVDRDAKNRLRLRLVRDAVIGPGAVFNASEWHCNVHWFAAIGGPALIFNINARGYEKSVFETQDDRRFGRRYIDPTKIDADGLAVCEEFGPDIARARFQRRDLNEFPVPAPLAGKAAGETIPL